MAENKNSFLGARMNKDIDGRLTPSNEYRNAVNVSVTRSEAADVGTLQNVLGNKKIRDFNVVSGDAGMGLQCIGTLADATNNRLFVFLTNYNDITPLGTYSATAKNYIYVYNNLIDDAVLLVEGAFLNFSISKPILAVNILEDLLFWTDNRNQPRRINISRAATASYYTTEDQISVSKPSPVRPISLHKELLLSPGVFETTMQNVTEEFLLNGFLNPYYEPNYVGDSTYLEDRFVRFSYRFVFEDGEYSIIAPFTQIAYIPKQDGYFLYKPPATGATEPEQDDESAAYRSTIVSFMQNKVNKITLRIVLPGPANTLNSLFKISEIEILYKDADELAVSVVDSIPVNPTFNGNTALIYEYEYQSKKPYKTLPNRDIIRVNDRTPIKALGQEIISNRVVYANYQDKFTYKKYLDYNVGYSDKTEYNSGVLDSTSLVEYPNHSLKQNRNYQVGVVLCDKFGRESGVILSDRITAEDPSIFGASSLYVPYRKENETPVYQWPGYSLKILFNSQISPAEPGADGWPGLYNGIATDPGYNPLGWYSYKIVVRQTEQDYYNVYLPGTMAAYPRTDPITPPKELGKTSHIVLLNDNINKVPRDLKEVGPTQLIFRSSVVLFPRVMNTQEVWTNEQSYPGSEYAIASSIGTIRSLFLADESATATNIAVAYDGFYSSESNPLVARLSTFTKLGVVDTAPDEVVNLSILETKPFESKLDIYWETSSVGIIEELNAAILSGTDGAASIGGWDSFLLQESASPGDIVVNDIVFRSTAGDLVIPNEVILSDVRNINGDSRLDRFLIEDSGVGSYRLVVAPNKYFYYGYNANSLESYIFSIEVKSGAPQSTTFFNRVGALDNVLIEISPLPPDTINKASGEIDIFNFDAVNGSNPLGGNSTSDITWSITGSSIFSITPDGLLQNLDQTAEGTYAISVKATEAAGTFDIVEISVVYPFKNTVLFSSWQTKSLTNGSDSTTGTITITGADVAFYAEAIGDSSAVTSTDITVNGVPRSVIAQGSPAVRSSPVILPAGNYTYSVSVDVNSGSGAGGIVFTQPAP